MCSSIIDPSGQFVEVTAAGSSRSDAAQICRTGIHTVAIVTGSSESQGVMLPSAAESLIGDTVEVDAAGPSAFNLYCASGEYINDVEGGGIQFAPSTTVRRISSTVWIVIANPDNA